MPPQAESERLWRLLRSMKLRLSIPSMMSGGLPTQIRTRLGLHQIWSSISVAERLADWGQIDRGLRGTEVRKHNGGHLTIGYYRGGSKIEPRFRRPSCEPYLWRAVALAAP